MLICQQEIGAYKETGASWRSFWDPASPDGSSIAERWNVHGWPTLYLIDAKGVIRYKGDYLRSVSVRQGKDGKFEQFSYLDVALENLMKEKEKEAKP